MPAPLQESAQLVHIGCHYRQGHSTGKTFCTMGAYTIQSPMIQCIIRRLDCRMLATRLNKFLFRLAFTISLGQASIARQCVHLSDSSNCLLFFSL